MKKILIFLLGFLSLQIHAETTQIQKSFYKELADIYTIDNEGIYIERVFEFPSISKSILLERVQSYLNNRISRSTSATNTSNANKIYDKDAFIVNEEHTFKLDLVNYPCVHYVYMIEVKEEKIRATIFLSTIEWSKKGGHVIPMYNFYPFKKINSGHSALKKIAKYVCTEILDVFPDELASAVQKQRDRDDW